MNNESFSDQLIVHVPGRTPSLREIQGLSALIEGAFAWAVVRAILSGELSADTSSDQLRDSYRSFLRRRYSTDASYAAEAQGFSAEASLLLVFLIIALASSQKTWKLPESQTWRDLEKRAQNLTQREAVSDPLSAMISRRGLGQADFRFQDFYDWAGEQYGRDLLTVDRVSSRRSLELVLRLGAVAMIFGLQQQPLVKDIALYSISVLQHWLGKARPPRPGIHDPRLSPDLAKLVAKYDDVDIEASERGWKIKLTR